jgi:hypothetical protein
MRKLISQLKPTSLLRNHNSESVDFSMPLAGLLFLVLAFHYPNISRADVWVERMLEVREHDFGKLDQGADAVWRFSVTNVYKHKIVLSCVRSSCGCTTASLEKSELDPTQTGFIVAKFNTRLNPGIHNATLTVQTSWNDNGVLRTGEAAVKVSGIVRANITVEPREITFANVPHNKSHEQQLIVSAEHDPAWRLKTVQCSCENLQVSLPQPLTSSQQVVYEVPVRLSKSTPVGALSEQLLLTTNDATAPRIPVHVSGRVTQDLWTSEYIFIGEVVAGEKVSKKVVVRGTKPCQITSIKSNSEQLQFKTDEVASTRHVVEITFQAKQVGQSKELISITSDSGQTANVTAFMTVVSASRP